MKEVTKNNTTNKKIKLNQHLHVSVITGQDLLLDGEKQLGFLGQLSVLL